MTVTYKSIQEFAANNLKYYQLQFKKNPSSQNWELTINAMMAFQQASQASYSRDRQALLVEALTPLHLGAWAETIVKTMTGMTTKEVLAAG